MTVDGALVALAYAPINYASNVDINQVLGVTFSEAILSGSAELTLSKLSGELIETFAPGSDRLAISGSVLSISPTDPLESGAAYQLVLPAGSVITIDGQPNVAAEYIFYTAGFDPYAGAHLEIRNVDLNAEYAEYDLYFVYDENYIIQEGKVLGIRVHEYGSTYSFTATSLTEGRRTSSAGYGNGGS